MKWLVLVLVLIAGSAGTSHAQVFKPRGKGPLLKKVDLKSPEPVKAAPEAKSPVAVKAAAEPKSATKAKPATSRVARDSRPDDLTPAPVKKKKVARKKKKGGDDDDVKVSDDDDDVKVSDD